MAKYKLGYLLSQASPYLLLLSATPHSGKTEPFLRLVRLLDEEAFPNSKSIVKEQVAPYLIRTEKREAIDNNGNLLFKNRVTHLVELQWDERHTFQRELYDLIRSYVSTTYGKATRNRKKNMCLIFLPIIIQLMVTSSTPEPCAPIEGVAKQAEFQHPDVKVERLVDTIDEILSEDQNQKIIIFTEFVATQKYLKQPLENRGFTVSVLNG